jgi:hypothetical protein
MPNRVKLKEMEGCSSHEENTKESMEERDTYKNRLAVTKTIYYHRVIGRQRIMTWKKVNEIDRKIIYPGHRLTTEILNHDRRFQKRDLKAICPA